MQLHQRAAQGEGAGTYSCLSPHHRLRAPSRITPQCAHSQLSNAYRSFGDAEPGRRIRASRRFSRLPDVRRRVCKQLNAINPCLRARYDTVAMPQCLAHHGIDFALKAECNNGFMFNIVRPGQDVVIRCGPSVFLARCRGHFLFFFFTATE